jgi:hypothetical protein
LTPGDGFRYGYDMKHALLILPAVCGAVVLIACVAVIVWVAGCGARLWGRSESRRSIRQG